WVSQQSGGQRPSSLTRAVGPSRSDSPSVQELRQVLTADSRSPEGVYNLCAFGTKPGRSFAASTSSSPSSSAGRVKEIRHENTPAFVWVDRVCGRAIRNAKYCDAQRRLRAQCWYNVRF